MKPTCTKCSCSGCISARRTSKADLEKLQKMERELKSVEDRVKKIEKSLKRITHAPREGQVLLRKG
jgi:hypothetical protein